MDYVGAFLGGTALLGLTLDGILKRFDKKTSKFPSCKTCGSHMLAIGLSKFIPGEVSNHLDKYGLPTATVSRFVCPKGHYHLWYIPRFGNTEKPFFFKEELR
jgi:hypothetical protein